MFYEVKLELVCVIGIEITVIDSNAHIIMHLQIIYNSECNFNSSCDCK